MNKISTVFSGISMKKINYYILIPMLLIILAISIYFISPIKTKHNLNLPSNSINKIISYLQKERYSVNILDKLFLEFATHPIKGRIYISRKELPRYKFLLAVGSKVNHYTPITIIPGETTYFVLQSISQKLDMNSTKLNTAYKELKKYNEGNFLANTYNIPIYFKERDVIKFIIDNSFKEYKKISKTYFNEFNLEKFKRILTIASIIQKEAANRAEMPLVSSVIFNRLNKKMRLQMDGTLNYGIYSHSKITPKRIKGDSSSYNTYRHKGLPNNPVCNVSKSAILAAIMPAKTDYLYFMKSSKDGHNFSNSYKKHIKNIKKRKEYLNKF